VAVFTRTWRFLAEKRAKSRFQDESLRKNGSGLLVGGKGCFENPRTVVFAAPPAGKDTETLRANPGTPKLFVRLELASAPRALLRITGAGQEWLDVIQIQSDCARVQGTEKQAF